MKIGKRPNIIFFFSDQQRWDTVGCYGQRMNVTPNLDKMAQEGVRFEYSFTCQPVCGPARSCIQIGKYATETGCYRNNIALSTNEKTIAHHFSEAGYEVAYTGKWHLASTGVPSYEDIGEECDYQKSAVPSERRGGYKDFWLASDVLEYTSHGYDGHMFDANMNKIEFKGYRADCVTDFALEYLRTRDGKKPFFLFISYIEPHHQNDHNEYEGPRGSKEKFKNFEVPGDLVGVEGNWRKNYPDYLGCCASLDYNLGRIRKELAKLAITENTVIIYTSDHGSHFRTRNKNKKNGDDDYKRSCHEASIRIPMIIYGPGFKGGKLIKRLVSLIDISPTLLRCAGIEKPKYMHGHPLQELVEGNAKDWPKEIFIQISESQVGRAIRTRKWKYSVRAPGKHGGLYAFSDIYVDDFLYDLEGDPHERHNLIRDPAYAYLRKELRETLKRRMIEANEKIPRILPVGRKRV